MSGNFGFDVSNVFGGGSFGSARKGRKSGKSAKKKKNVDALDCLNCGGLEQEQGGFGLGIDTFSLKDPSINALGLGSDFGDQIGVRAGQANGKRGGFLDVIGSQQLSVPSVTGRGRIASRGRGKGRSKTTRAKTPLQRATGTRFGNVDKEFAGNVIGNVRGARKRIQAFRDKRKRSKTKSTPERPALPPPPAQQLRQPERPALPPPRASSLGARPSETGSQAIARLRQEEESRSAT